MGVLNRAADRLQDALDGEAVDPTFPAELNTARSLEALELGAGPDPSFVGALRERLQTEAVELRPERRAAGRTPVAATPRRLLVGGRAIGGLAGAAAALVVLAALLGFTAQSALPGEALYPMRLALDRAAVSVDASNRDKGTTLLTQAERHLADASALAARSHQPRDGIQTAVEATGEAADDGHRILLSDFAKTREAVPLDSLRSFSDRTIPKAEALAAVVPADNLPGLTTLRSLLAQIRTSALQTLAACPTCGSAADEARRSLQSTPTRITPTGSSFSSTATIGPEPSTQTTESASPRGSATVPGPPAASGSVGPTSLSPPGPPTSASPPPSGTAPSTSSTNQSGGGTGPTEPARVPTLTASLPTVTLRGTSTCVPIDCR